jgi:hypothetical protein
MIYFDVTQTGAARHHSGLNRVNVRLRTEAGNAFTAVAWPNWSRRTSDPMIGSSRLSCFRKRSVRD